MTALSAPARGGSSLRWLLSDALVFTRRNFEHTRQLPERLIEVTIQPVMFVLLFAYVFGGAIAIPGGSYREYLMAGILVQSLAFGLMGPAIKIAADLNEGVIDRFLSLPTSRLSYLLGHVIAEMSGMALATAVLSVTGLIVGWRTHAGIEEVIGAYALLMLFSASMVWAGTLIGLFVRSTDAVAGVVFTFIFPLTFLSSAFVPIETLPKILEYFAAYNPISVLIAAVRDLWGNPTAPISHSVWPLEHPLIASIGWCAGILAIVVPLTLVRFRQRTST
ncbi:MAG TPA: ABC transporter permease [Dehalococcoidia bacterium]|nr:ABC transporter permease [Dehalococcoidia bacterium]